MSKTADSKIQKDALMLARMVEIYCCDHHSRLPKPPFALRGILANLRLGPVLLCRDCARLLTHGLTRRLNCPFDPKPACKHCPRPCYSDEYRGFIKIVMRYSGLRLIRSGRIDLIWRYFF